MAKQPDGSQYLIVDLVEVPVPQAAVRLRQALDLVLAAAARVNSHRDAAPWPPLPGDGDSATPPQDPEAPP